MNTWWILGLLACSGDESTDTPTDAIGDDDDDAVGDDDDDGVDIIECDEAFDPCGGDPTGTWDVDAVCEVFIDTSALQCGEITYDITDDRSSGTIDLAAGGVYDRQYTVDIDFVIYVPTTCLIGPITCNGLAALSGGLLDDCVENVDQCDCTGSLQENDSYAGTWSIEGGNTIVTDGGDRTQFCIQGNYGVSQDEGTEGGRVHWRR